MEKVKVTQEELQTLNVFRHNGRTLRTFVESRELIDLNYRTLIKFTNEEFALLLCDWYEVEPEFQREDLVFYKDEKEMVLKQITDLFKLRNGDGYCSYTSVDGKQRATNVPLDSLRHATPSEIAEEKERRFFKKHDRDVWELKRLDILIALDGDYPVTVKRVLPGGHTLFFGGTVYTDISDVKEGYSVACFAENRMDVISDE